MEFVKKCKRVWGIRHKRLHPENNSGSGSYGKLRSKEKKKKTPHGCICVYVGAERERFVVKIKMANHPLFKTLLDASEREYGYGYRNDGPLWIPCDVHLFSQALVAMESAKEDMGYSHRHSPSSSVSNHYDLFGLVLD